jgi:hypothetical protein
MNLVKLQAAGTAGFLDYVLMNLLLEPVFLVGMPSRRDTSQAQATIRSELSVAVVGSVRPWPPQALAVVQAVAAA